MNSEKRSPKFIPRVEDVIRLPRVILSKVDLENILKSDSDDEYLDQQVKNNFKITNDKSTGDLQTHLEKSLHLKSERESPSKKRDKHEQSFTRKNIPCTKKFKPTSEWIASLIESDDEDSQQRPNTPIRLKICRANKEDTEFKCDSPITPRESKRKLKAKTLDYDDIVKNQFSPSPPKQMNIKSLKETAMSEPITPKGKIVRKSIASSITPKSKSKLKKGVKNVADLDNKEELVQEILKSRKCLLLSKFDEDHMEVEPAETPTKKIKNKLLKEVKSENKQNSSPKKKNLENLTPKKDLKDQELETLQEVRQRLHVAKIPDTLPCRDREFSNIYNFIKNKLIDGMGGCMYISGVPGTGKTATVHAVVRSLQNEMKQEDLPKFKFVEINGLHLIKPQQAYKYLLIGLEGESAKKFSCEEAKEKLERRFNGKTKMATLVLVDELDQLCTRRQDLIYTLLDWPRRVNSQLLVITVANTMDLPERLLMGRVASRLGLTRLTFQPYSFKQLMEIVTQRLIGFEAAFDPDGAQLIARKVASLSGDARRALDLCRRAAEIAKNRVEMQHVNAALEEMLTSPKMKTILSCSYFEILFLRAIAFEIQRTGVDESIFAQVYQQLCTLANLEGIQEPSLCAGLRICQALTESRLILVEKTRIELYKKILLNVNIDELHYALKSITCPSEKI